MNVRIAACVAAVAAVATPPVAAEGSGYFRMADNRQEYSHAYAVARDSFDDPPQREVTVYLTSDPVSLEGIATALDLDNHFTGLLREQGGSMVRIDLPQPDSGGPSMWFWDAEPSDTFNMSGSGEFELTQDTPQRVAGSWILAEPAEFFDKTYEFRLEFAADVADANPKGTALPAGGGEPGAAWLAHVKAVAGKDVAHFRAELGDMAEYMLPEDDPEAVESWFESQRWGSPKEAKVLGGLLMDDVAILRVAGTDYDGNKVSGAVHMQRGEDGWEQVGSDLSTQW